MDTLYFELDEDYMVNGNNYRNLKGAAFNKQIAKKKTRAGTNGYIYYLADTILPLSGTPDLKSLKDYIENEVFCYEGEYNEIINEIINEITLNMNYWISTKFFLSREILS